MGPEKAGSRKFTSTVPAISTLCPARGMLRATFNTNRERQEHFALLGGAGACIMPPVLREIVVVMPALGNRVVCCGAPCLERLAKARFGARSGAFARNFAAPHNNSGAFSLFLEMGCRVLFFHFFSELCRCFLTSMLRKREYDRETERKSLGYERAPVPCYFGRGGFAYFPTCRSRCCARSAGLPPQAPAHVWSKRRRSPQALLGRLGRVHGLALIGEGRHRGATVRARTRHAKRRCAAPPGKTGWIRRNKTGSAWGRRGRLEGPRNQHLAARVRAYGLQDRARV